MGFSNLFQSSPVPLQKWHLILLAGIASVAIILAFLDHLRGTEPQAILTEETCTQAGGSWNACGSLCRGTDAFLCADVCTQECGCISDDECPFGFTCSDYIDGKGLCLKH